MRAFWGRRSKLGKAAIIVVVALVGLTILGALLPAEEETTSGDTTTQTTTENQPQTTEPEEQPDAVTGKVTGAFARDCIFCDERLVRFVKTSNVWCGWRDDTLLVHVRMRNTSVEHITVNWHPSYIIARGGEHGTGIGSTQSDGFDAGETRDLTAEQHPEGVEPGAAIATCKPSFSVIESG